MDEPDDAPDVRILWDKRPVARKEHRCNCCADPISVGAKYESSGMIIDGEFIAAKLHLDAYGYPSGCPAIRVRDLADEARQFEADRAMLGG